MPFGRRDYRVCLCTLQLLDFLFRVSVFGHRRILGTLQVILKTFLGNAGFIVAILPVVHGKLEEFLVIIAIFPTVFVHLFPVCIQSIRVVQLRVRIHELKTLGLGQFHYLGRQSTGQASALAQNHVPRMVVYHRPALLSLYLLHEVHQSHILHILAERSHQRRIAQFGPYIFHFVEQHDE